MVGDASVPPLPADLWRRSRWNLSPASQPRRRPAYEAAVLCMLVVWNLTANLVVPEAASLLVSAAGVAILLVIARHAGATWDDLGLRPGTWQGGLRVGAAAMAVITATTVVLAAVPATRTFLADDRFLGEGVGEMVYETMVRIPLATALGEEIAFRGVVLGLLLLWVSPLRAMLVSAALFGIWHVLPAISALETSEAVDVVPGAAGAFGAVIGQVLVTGFAGFGFAWLRFRGNSLVSPVLAHWAINGTAYLAGWLIVRNAWA